MGSPLFFDEFIVTLVIIVVKWWGHGVVVDFERGRLAGMNAKEVGGG